MPRVAPTTDELRDALARASTRLQVEAQTLEIAERTGCDALTAMRAIEAVYEHADVPTLGLVEQVLRGEAGETWTARLAVAGTTSLSAVLAKLRSLPAGVV